MVRLLGPLPLTFTNPRFGVIPTPFHGYQSLSLTLSQEVELRIIWELLYGLDQACRPWELRNQTELSDSVIVLWVNSIPYPVLPLNIPTLNLRVGWNQTALQEFIWKPFITKAQKKLTMLFKPLWFCTCHLLSLFTGQAHTHPLRLA